MELRSLEQFYSSSDFCSEEAEENVGSNRTRLEGSMWGVEARWATFLPRADATQICQDTVPEGIGRPARCHGDSLHSLVEACVDGWMAGGRE